MTDAIKKLVSAAKQAAETLRQISDDGNNAQWFLDQCSNEAHDIEKAIQLVNKE